MKNTKKMTISFPEAYNTWNPETRTLLAKIIYRDRGYNQTYCYAPGIKKDFDEISDMVALILPENFEVRTFEFGPEIVTTDGDICKLDGHEAPVLMWADANGGRIARVEILGIIGQTVEIEEAEA